MKYGFILAAGNQTRFNSMLPKALVNIDGRCLLDYNIELLNNICDTVYVVCSYDNRRYFDGSKYRLIEVESGHGSGDALYKAMNRFFFSWEDQVVVCWGDVILNNKIIDKLSQDAATALIPCVWEDKPYVRFEFGRFTHAQNSSVRVYYSKYGAEIKPGYHDMSIFKFNAKRLKRALFDYVEEFACPNNLYKGNNNEFELLEIFNNGFPGDALILHPEESTKSFNSIEELVSLHL